MCHHLHGWSTINLVCVPSAVLQECLLGGLQSVADEDLPMLTSDFYSKHMLPSKSEGTAPCFISDPSCCKFKRHIGNL